MKKNKLAQIASIILAGATTVAVGLTAGCGGNKHNWSDEWDYDSTHHWHECLDDGCEELKDKATHVDANSDGKCDVCKAIVSASHTHNYNKWGSNDTQHWKYCEVDNVIDETTRANHNYSNGNCVCGKADPNGSLTPPPVETVGKNEYTVYLYAPEAASGTSIKVSVWGEMAGAFNDGSAMTAVPEHTGWYSFTFKTDKEIADGANFNYYVGDVETPTTTGYTTDANWVYFISNKADIKYNSMAAAEAAYNAIANPGGEDEDTETTTVYFHKPTDWVGSWIGAHAYYGAGDVAVTGNWGETKMTVDSGEWYKVDIELPEGTASFNIIIFDENDGTTEIRKAANVTIGIGANVYINAKGKVFTTKEAAEADEDDTIPKAYSYTFYMYAPDASSVTIGVWGNFAGEIADGTPMTAVNGHEGWYSYTLNTDIELKAGNGINLNIFVDGTNKGKYSESETDLYFISVGGDRGFADFASAEEKYAELTAPVDPSDQEQVTIHIKVNTESVSGTPNIYVWGDNELFGGWPGAAMTAESDGWYSVTISAKKNLSGTYNVIINNGAQYDAGIITVTDGSWSSDTTDITITKD